MANILVIDDEVGIRELFSEILADEGYNVITAANSAEANRLRQTLTPDVILLDIWMPDMDGMSLLKEWASQGPLPCPVIMMSGHANIDMAVEATKFGAYTFLEKPTSMRALIETVNNALLVHQEQQKTIETSVNESKSSQEDQPTSLSTCEIDFHLPLRQAREQFEQIYFKRLLEEENYRMSRVAQRAQLERTHLYRKLRQLGIEWSKDES